MNAVVKDARGDAAVAFRQPGDHGFPAQDRE